MEAAAEVVVVVPEASIVVDGNVYVWQAFRLSLIETIDCFELTMSQVGLLAPKCVWWWEGVEGINEATLSKLHTLR